MTEKKYYTIGELARLGLLLTHDDRPITDKPQISRIVNKLGYIELSTPWGVAKGVTQEQVDEYNKKRLKIVPLTN